MSEPEEPKLHTILAQRVGLRTATEVLLFDRLLWLRNHYDIGDRSLKQQVLADVDAILDHVRSDPRPRRKKPR